MSDGLFKLNVINDFNKFFFNVFNVETTILWHERLGHVSLKKVKKLIDLGLLPRSQVDVNYKYQIYVQAKQTKKSFKSVQRNTNILELIYSDVCDSNRIPARAENKYFATFINDYFRYYYVYLLKSKDEIFSKFKVYKT